MKLFRNKSPKKSVSSVDRRHQYYARRKRNESMQRLGVIAGVIILLLTVFLVGKFSSSSGGDADNDSKDQANASSQSNPIAGKQLYVDPNNRAAKQAAEWRTTQPARATVMDKLSDQPGAYWLSGPITYDMVNGYVRAANDKNALPVLVAYYIPNRDCNKYSSGGAKNEAEYNDYIDTLAQAIGNMDAVVILEPDALVHMQSSGHDGQACAGNAERDMYMTLLSYAVDRLKSLPATSVYIDAGNSGWTQDTDTIASLLKAVNIDTADGFSINVSNFRTTEESLKYGRDIAGKVDNKHFIVDTSRNGLGPYDNPKNPDFNWCNPPDRALGHYPTTSTHENLVDAFLYVKNIGESDGSDPDPNKCFNGPKAGEWWPDYALGLVERWPKELQFAGRPQ